MNHYACWFYDWAQKQYICYDLKYHYSLFFDSFDEMNWWAIQNDVELEAEIAH